MEPIIEDFVNREEPLAALHELARGNTPCRVMLIWGVAGIGKAYLLKEFQAECAAAGIPCAHVALPRSKDQTYMNLVLSLWEQLQLGDPAELKQHLIAVSGSWAVMPVPAPPAGRRERAAPVAVAPSAGDGATLHPSTTLYNAQIQGDFVNRDKVYNEIYNYYVEVVQKEDPLERSAVQAEVARLLFDRLAAVNSGYRTMLLFSDWEPQPAAAEARVERLEDRLIDWVLDGKLPNAAAVITGVQAPSLGRLPQRIAWHPLKELTDEAVRTYWVNKWGLSPEDIPGVISVTGGLPLAVNLTAERYLRERADGSTPRQPGNGPLTAQTAVERAVDALLEAIPAVAEAVRLGAIPHWFDEALLSHLYEHQLDHAAVMEHLRSFRFVREDAEGRFTYSPNVRTYLLAWWQRQENRDRYTRASRIAAEHFRTQAETATLRERQAFDLERLYHTIACAEPEGLRELSDRLDAACESYQLDLARQLVAQTQELAGFLSGQGRVWLRYFEAYLDLASHRHTELDARFEAVGKETADPYLRALVLQRRGRLGVEQHRWSDAVGHYRAGLALLEQQASPAPARQIARVMLALGDAYVDLANNCGGFRPESAPPADALTRVLHVAQHLPFLLYERLLRRVSFLPNWYFGTDYQNWIISYLFMEANRWHRQAEQRFAALDEPLLLGQVRLSLAEGEHQMGRWSRAQDRYATLLKRQTAEESGESPYRRARIELGQGAALVEEGQWAAAETGLREALQVFRNVSDQYSLGVAAALLGRAQVALGNPAQAAADYLESAQAFGSIDRKVHATQVICALEELAQHGGLPDEQKRAVAGFLEHTPERHYLARFPDRLLSWYRRLALLGVLPVTYLWTFIISLFATLVFLIIEGEVMLARTGANAGTKTTDVLILLACVLFPIPLALWFYRLLYSVIGIIFVRYSRDRLVRIEREQPVQIVVDAAGVTRQEIRSDRAETAAWSDVVMAAPIDYRLLHRSIDLISDTTVRLKSGHSMAFFGITQGYDHLKADVARRLEQAGAGGRLSALVFTVFELRWVLAALAVCLAVALVPVLSGHPIRLPWTILETGVTVKTSLAGLVLCFAPTAALVFPALTVWRLLGYRLRLEKLGVKFRAVPTWLLWLLAILGTLLAAAWVAVIIAWAFSPPELM